MEFFQTVMGKQFFDSTLPRLVRAVERLAQATEERAWKDLIDNMTKNKKGRRYMANALLVACEEAGELEDSPPQLLRTARADVVLYVMKSRGSSSEKYAVFTREMQADEDDRG